MLGIDVVNVAGVAGEYELVSDIEDGCPAAYVTDIECVYVEFVEM